MKAAELTGLVQAVLQADAHDEDAYIVVPPPRVVAYRAHAAGYLQPLVFSGSGWKTDGGGTVWIVGANDVSARALLKARPVTVYLVGWGGAGEADKACYVEWARGAARLG